MMINKGFISFISVIFFYFIGYLPIAEAQSKASSKGWHLLDPDTGSIYGASVTKAYAELLADKKSHQVIVAVMDVGVDISHQDLQNHIWTNQNEIPANGIDDDNNGYTDDVHGWNFLGNGQGENIVFESLESSRVYYLLKPLFEHVTDSNQVAQNARNQYSDWLDLKRIHTTDSAANANEITIVTQQLKSCNYIDSLLSTLGQKDAWYESDADQLRAGTDVSATLKDSISDLFTNYVGPFNSLEKYIAQKEKIRQQLLTTQSLLLHPEAQRKKIVGDDPYDIADSIYGNNNVSAGITDHGTHIAGIIGAARSNDFGMDGIAENVLIMPLRTGSAGDERDKDVALAIRYAVDNGARVINMSFGKLYSPQKAWVDEAIKYAADHDVLLVHGAMNASANNDSVRVYPNANLSDSLPKADNFITVGASTAGPGEFLVANFSNYGKKEVDLFAPGQNIYSSISGNKFEKASGTSMATPVVAGIAALILEYYPGLSARQLKLILIESVKQFPDLKVKLPGTNTQVLFSSLSVSGGVVNAYNALQLASTMKGERKDKRSR